MCHSRHPRSFFVLLSVIVATCVRICRYDGILRAQIRRRALKWSDVTYGEGEKIIDRRAIECFMYIHYIRKTTISNRSIDWRLPLPPLLCFVPLFWRLGETSRAESAMQVILCSAINWTKDWIESYNSFRDMHTDHQYKHPYSFRSIPVPLPTHRHPRRSSGGSSVGSQ